MVCEVTEVKLAFTQNDKTCNWELKVLPDEKSKYELVELNTKACNYSSISKLPDLTNKLLGIFFSFSKPVRFFSSILNPNL